MEFEQIKQLIKAVSDSSLTSFSYEESALKIVIRRCEPGMPEESPAKTDASEGVPQGNTKDRGASENTGSALPNPETEAFGKGAPQDEAFSQSGAPNAGNLVTSPLVGTFYSAPSEDSKPYVRVGDTVKKGQVIAIIEAMKLMNEIESDYDGVIAEILVKNGEMVDYGKPLFRIQ